MPSYRNALLLCTIPMLLAPGAQAQSNSCELLKQTLASRIPPEIKGYAMDDVPARTPVPAGGKVIGTCEGGARKVIYRRFGGAPIATDGPAGSAPAPAAQAPTPAPTAAPKPASAPAPVVAQKEAPKPKPEPVVPPKPVAPPVTPPPVIAAPKPAPAPPPTPVPVPAPAPVVRAAPVIAPVTSASSPVVALAKPAAIQKTVEPPAPLAPPAPAPVADSDEPGFFGAYGRWLWLLLALPVIALLWSWVSHRMAYDSAGLPRGPRL